MPLPFTSEQFFDVFADYNRAVWPMPVVLLGQRYPATPTFGLPCPTTIYTFGLLLAARPCPLRLLVIPAVWSLLGSSAAWQLGVAADYGLLVAGVVGRPSPRDGHSGGSALPSRTAVPERRSRCSAETS